MHLAIDVGNKRCGIAIEQEGIVFPKEICARTDIIAALRRFLREYPQIHTMVVGMPYDLYGIDTEQLEKTQRFQMKLQDIFPSIQIIGFDERFSSFEASQTHDTEKRDDVAAGIILESYLRSKI
ncbi:MAG: Holliday junction resolvase RuvX [Candidatus Peribacteria bacterium]|nr:MAG: Holliday junction resolvase RuvX [Candidatus Peribacteria bacterium]